MQLPPQECDLFSIAVSESPELEPYLQALLEADELGKQWGRGVPSGRFNVRSAFFAPPHSARQLAPIQALRLTQRNRSTG